MLVFWKARVVLLSMPKTGSTALDAAFAPHADVVFRHPQHLKHMSVVRYRSEFQRLFEGSTGTRLELFAVMREPRDWLASWYRYRARPEISGTARSTRGMDFDAFVRAWLDDAPPVSARVGRQSRFLNAPGDVPGVDRLFRYDRLEDLVSMLQHRLNVDVELPVLNASPLELATHLTPETERRLRSEAAADFALWDALDGS